jgi:hypothetical protein
MIVTLKKAEKENNLYGHVELKVETLAYWQTYLRRAK